jgi:hypothetical protein
LRRRLGLAVRDVDLSGEFGNAQHDQKFQHLKDMLAYWEGRTGLGSGVGGGIIGSMLMGLHLDETEDDVEADVSGLEL